MKKTLQSPVDGSMETTQLVKMLNENVVFPCHGCVADEDNYSYLLFPLTRAVRERFTPLIEQSTGIARVSPRDFRPMTYFLKSWDRTLTVLDQIARIEKELLAKHLQDGMIIQEAAPVLHAYQLLPIWTEYFFINFRVLSDRLAVVLGHLAVTNLAEFPRTYRKLLKAAEDGGLPNAHWQTDGKALLAAIKGKSDWFNRLAGKGERRGIRDSLLHRLTDTLVIKELSGWEPRRIEVTLRSEDKNAREMDLLSEIQSVICGFCEYLSAFPPNLWMTKGFTEQDLVRAESSWPALERFFPKMPLSSG